MSGEVRRPDRPSDIEETGRYLETTVWLLADEPTRHDSSPASSTATQHGSIRWPRPEALRLHSQGHCQLPRE